MKREKIRNFETFNESTTAPLELRLAYKKWVEAEDPNYLGPGDRDLRMRYFLKLLNDYPNSSTAKLIDSLSSYGEMPRVLKQIRRFA